VLLFCEVVTNLFIALAGILVLLSAFWVVPCMLVMVRDEMIASKGADTGRHRFTGVQEDEYIIKLTEAFRDGRNGVRSHRRVAHG
jgi:hypothetical protein